MAASSPSPGPCWGVIRGAGAFRRPDRVGKRGELAIGYLIGAVLMIAAGLVVVWLGVSAEQKPLEEIATPLTAEDASAPVHNTPTDQPDQGDYSKSRRDVPQQEYRLLDQWSLPVSDPASSLRRRDRRPTSPA
jgi:HAMP domain-containing protein